MRQFAFGVAFALFIFSKSAQAQTTMHLYPQKYTSTAFTVFNVNQACYGSGLRMYINGQEFTNFTYGLCNFGICQFRFPFGNLSVGDVITVRDACGNQSTPITVTDDFVYVEVPNGNSYSGNNIGPNDTGLPFARLNTPVYVGKCEPIDINSHTLHEIKLFLNANGSTFTTGTYKLNGSPINASMFSIDNFGNSGSNLTFNSNGSISTNGTADLYSNQSFSGQTPVSLEYIHNGQNPRHEFFIGPLSVQFQSNSTVTVKEFRYDGSEIQQNLNGDFTNSKFLFTFNNGEFKLFIDDVERKVIQRSVIYSASSGSISNGGLLPYTSGVTWSPGGSGEQWVQAIMDGIRVVRQRFYVQEDMVINQTVTHAACNGESTGSVELQVSGGQPGLLFSKDNVIFSSGSTFGGLAAGSYTFYVRDASGCTAQKNISVGENPPLSMVLTNKTNANCVGQANGSATLEATGGAGLYEYGYGNSNYQISPTIQNLVSGDYVFAVRDAAGCIKTISENIGLNSSLNASVASKQNLLCYNDGTGSITLQNTGVASGLVEYSMDGLVFQTSPVFNSLPAGMFTFTIRDNLCTVSTTETLIQPPLLSIIGSIDQHVSCFGGNNAQISLTAAGGTTPYMFSPDDIQFVSNSVFSGLPIGNYKYWVRDHNGCRASTDIFTIIQPSDISFSVSSKTDVSCFGANNGEVQLVASGGVPAFSYSMDNTNFQTSNVFSGLNFGLKTFTVRDQNACTKTLSTTLSQPELLQLSVSLTKNLICNNDSTGQVSLQAVGGTLPYTFFKNGASPQSSSVFTRLSATSYIFRVKDAQNCETSLAPITLTQPTPIAISHVQKTDVDCETYSTGALQFSASGSNGGFSYTLTGKDFQLIDMGTLTASNGLFENLKAGNYLLTATDQQACAMTYPASIIPKNSGIRFDLEATLPTNCVADDGAIRITNIEGGRPEPGYVFRINGSNGFTTQSQFNNLSNGEYIITVADNLCSYNKSVSLRLPGSLNAQFTISPISCSSPNAHLSVHGVSGGNGNYQFGLNEAPPNNITQYYDLVPGTYSVLIQDQPLSCKTAFAVEIKEQNRADLKTSEVKNISCFGGSDGFIRAIGDNNLSPFSYSFNNLSNFSSNNNFGGLPIGTYRIYARNSIGCLDSIRVSLSQPTKIEWDVTVKNNDCFGDQTGVIDIIGSGGTPPYRYAIEGAFVENNQFKDLFAGTYSPTIVDSKNCLFTQTVQVIQPPELVIVPIYQDTITCFGLKNGVVRIDASGGTPGYLYAINNQNVYDNGSEFAGLAAGKYTFFVKDKNQCLKNTEINVTEPPVLELDLIDQKDPLCLGDANGLIKVQARGGNNGGYTYILDNSRVRYNDGLFEGLSQGVYTLKVEDRKACFDTITAIGLKWPQALSAAISHTLPVCYGDSNAVISIEVFGGAGGYKTLMTDTGHLEIEMKQITQNSFAFSKLPAGSFPFLVKDQNGCQLNLVHKIDDAVKLESPINLGGDLRQADSVVVCKGQLLELNAKNEGQQIQWYKNELEIVDKKNINRFETSEPGIYKVIVKNSTGCIVEDLFDFKNNNVVLNTDFLLPVETITGDTVVLLDKTFPQPDINTWLIPDDVEIIDKNNANISLIFNSEKTYTLGLKAQKDNCTIIKYYDIEVFEKINSQNTNPQLNLVGNDAILEFKVAPNPNYGFFIISYKFKYPLPATFIMTSAANGNIIWTGQNETALEGTKDVKIINFIPGVYNLTLKVAQSSKTIKILLLR